MAGKPRNRVGEVYSDGDTSITIISISDKREKSGSACWNGLCGCGQMRYDIPGSHLFHGNRKSRNSVTSCHKCAMGKQSTASTRQHAAMEEKRLKIADQKRSKLGRKVPEEWLNLPRSSAEGIALGNTQFFTGQPCTKGHLSPRKSSDGGCMECARLERASRAATPEGKAASRAYSAARWADPEKRKKLQRGRALWAETAAGKASLKSSYKSFYDNNKERINPVKQQRLAERYKEEEAYRIRKNLSRRIVLALKSQNTTKDKTTIELTGCDLNFLVAFIESQFEDWMNWDNHGNWHIDHLRPCASFDLSKPEQQSVCFNFRNLQPLEGHENMKKRDSYEPHHEVEWEGRMRELGYDGELFLLFEEGSGGLAGS